MLSNFEFVRQSLDLNLFFLRIMKEHSFFIEGGFTPANPELAACADEFKKEFARLLSEAVKLSQGVISPQVAASGEIVTGFTLKAEEATEFFTGIPINTNITRKELALVRCGDSVKASFLADDVCELNNRIIKALRDLIDFKGKLLQKILSCKIFTFNYPLLIEHIRREAVLFLNMLCRLQRRVETDLVQEAIEQEAFWNRIMAEHSEFIRGLLDPTEEMLIKTADKFANEFDELTAEALALHKRVSCLPEVTEDSLVATKHPEGDIFIREGARILQSCCRSGNVLARLTGDEFGILLPNTDYKTASEVVDSINKACAAFNKNKKTPLLYEISLSIGYATKEGEEESIQETLKKADEYLRNRKLFDMKSSHSNIILSLMATVYEKSEETEEHAQRLAVLSKKIGKKLNLPPNTLGELELFAMLHDIGKVGIYDGILNKPGELDDDELAIMKKHPEIGYRIAKSSSELEPIAEYILTHHERWDGKGYPQGLKGENIPLLSRILAVADAYDAMTEDRVYRKALTKEAAIEEIKKNAGIQFDPNIAQIFIDLYK